MGNGNNLIVDKSIKTNQMMTRVLDGLFNTFQNLVLLVMTSFILPAFLHSTKGEDGFTACGKYIIALDNNGLRKRSKFIGQIRPKLIRNAGPPNDHGAAFIY